MMPKTADFAVDLRHLDRYTGGDRAVNQGILVLFENQCQEMLARLEELSGETANPKDWREVTHTLKGAARGIGAFGLANEAAQAETTGPTDRRGAIEALQRMKAKSEAVYGFIEDFLKKPE